MEGEAAAPGSRATRAFEPTRNIEVVAATAVMNF